MQLVIHRVNTINELIRIPHSFGVEVDVRSKGSSLVLHHNPFSNGESFALFLKSYHHGLLALNIKESGIEAEVVRYMEVYGIKEYFLFDVEFPYIYRASRQGQSAIAIRYSEDEPIQTALNYQNKVDWVWIDTNTVLPLDSTIVSQLKGFKTCLVCPSRWGRAQDISLYIDKMRNLSFFPSAVMTSLEYVSIWQKCIH